MRSVVPVRTAVPGLLLLAAAWGCAPRPSAGAELVRLVAAVAPGGYRLTLLAAQGARINARLKPVLEVEGGGRLRFDAPSVTADSAYFTAPPGVGFDSPSGRLRGLLRVGVCPPGLKVCRSLALPVDQALPTG